MDCVNNNITFPLHLLPTNTPHILEEEKNLSCISRPSNLNRRILPQHVYSFQGDHRAVINLKHQDKFAKSEHSKMKGLTHSYTRNDGMVKVRYLLHGSNTCLESIQLWPLHSPKGLSNHLWKC